MNSHLKEIFITGHHVIRITWYRYAVRWWWFRIGRFSLKFYINANGYVTIGRKKIRLTASTQKKLPAKAGWVWFRWGNYYIYLRFDRRVMWVWLFTVNGACKKSWGGMKHFYGKTKAGKPKAGKPGKPSQKPKGMYFNFEKQAREK